MTTTNFKRPKLFKPTSYSLKSSTIIEWYNNIPIIESTNDGCFYTIGLHPFNACAYSDIETVKAEIDKELSLNPDDLIWSHDKENFKFITDIYLLKGNLQAIIKFIESKEWKEYKSICTSGWVDFTSEAPFTVAQLIKIENFLGVYDLHLINKNTIRMVKVAKVNLFKIAKEFNITF